MSNKQDRNNKQNDSSKVQSIDEISSQFKKKKTDLQKENAELRAFVAAQEITIQKALENIKEKEEQIEQLMKMLNKTVPVVGQVERIERSQEEMIAEAQLALLRHKAENLQEFTLEEARKFEIFLKAKNLSKDNSIPTDYKNLIPENKPDLLKLAKAPLKNPTDESEQ